VVEKLGNLHFVEVETDIPCDHCNRKRMKKNDKFYKVFAQDRDLGIIVCDLCRVGFLINVKEGSEKTYSTHLIFYVKNAISKIKNTIPVEIIEELDCAIENYENWRYSASFRSIGLIAEWLTKKIFIATFGTEINIPRWEEQLGKILNNARKNKEIPKEPFIFQLYSLKWFRNQVDHPSEYQITGEDIRMGLVSIIYLLSIYKKCV
jgi:hypothetical protein